MFVLARLVPGFLVGKGHREPGSDRRRKRHRRRRGRLNDAPEIIVPPPGSSLKARLWAFFAPRVDRWLRDLPLFSAILAPASTLYDIPALSQTWLGESEADQPGLNTELVLSSIELFFSVAANVVLVVRFSSVDHQRARWMTRFSTLIWILKTTISVVNLTIFAVVANNYRLSAFQEGFWCAVASAIISGLIAVFLLVHWLCGYDDDVHIEEKKSVQERRKARSFILSVMVLVALLALEALIFSRIEEWHFFDAIYFSVIAMTTIGYGDLHPTNTATRVLLFPFLLMTVGVLGYEIVLILGYFSESMERRKAAWRRHYEAKRDRLRNEAGPEQSLEKEMAYMDATHQREMIILHSQDAAFSLSIFLTFFLVGALAFHFMEGWSYGIGLYFCYITFMTVGFGDYSPTSPAGRVFLVAYAYDLTVPIVTSFAVQTITQIFVVLADRGRSKRDQVEEMRRLSHRGAPRRVVSHADIVAAQNQDLARKVLTRRESAPAPRAHPGEHHRHGASEEETFLLDNLIRFALQLEIQARMLMVKHMPEGSEAWTVLKADRHLQLRTLEALGGDHLGLRHFLPSKEELEKMLTMDEIDLVEAYRVAFAGLLAAASRLKKFETKPRPHSHDRRPPDLRSVASPRSLQSAATFSTVGAPHSQSLV